MTGQLVVGTGRSLEGSRGTVVRDLAIVYTQRKTQVAAVRGVDLSVAAGEKRALVGESGSGKTTVGRGVASLLPIGAQVVSGTVEIDGTVVSALSGARLLRARRELLGLVFQDPLNALDPLRTIGSQVGEAVRVRSDRHTRWSRSDLADAVKRLLRDCQLPATSAVMKQYPHELSGGMRQRVTIAMAIAGACRLLVADEPTTALDVVTQASIANLIDGLVQARGTGLLFITHNLALASGLCDTVSIMYAGQIVEEGSMRDVGSHPAHPYTQGLLQAVPVLGRGKGRLATIPGTPPTAARGHTRGCAFEPRCVLGRGKEICRTAAPPITYVTPVAGPEPAHWARCHFVGGAPPDAAEPHGSGVEQ